MVVVDGLLGGLADGKPMLDMGFLNDLHLMLRFPIFESWGNTPSSREGNMKTTRMILSNELAAKIKDAKNVLEEIAGSNQTTDVTAEWLYNLCELLDEVC
jgi:hypothetical protein